MMFEIHSHEGVGPIWFGMTPSEVRATLGVAFESFKRNEFSAHPCDHFIGPECFVYYDDANCLVEAVEFAEPAEPTLNGANLLGLGFAALIRQITEIDPEVSIEIDGFTSEYLGVGAWAPACQEEPEAPAESIIVFVRGYYG
jgi:hypothetical protein